MNISSSACLEVEMAEIKPLYLQKATLSLSHKLTLKFSDTLIRLPDNFVKDNINEKVIDLRARSAIDHEEVIGG